MSRIGETLIQIPDGVTLTNNNDVVIVKGPKGQLEFKIPEGIKVEVENNSIAVKRLSDIKTVRQLHGTVRSILNNYVIGTSKGFEKKLEIRGVGYRAKIAGKELILSIGKSHDVIFIIPDEVTVVVEANTKLSVSGISKEIVGAAAAKIRSFYPPEPYKGKGIRYVDEYVRQKAGKTIAG
ncbi:MAG: 50S ribosomal protein L6 [Chlamydiae bacterium]|nr:MAG: 50S ribosomal protein L6 [Chlamydiota bacterium]